LCPAYIVQFIPHISKAEDSFIVKVKILSTCHNTDVICKWLHVCNRDILYLSIMASVCLYLQSLEQGN
jgi:hypothetical protein